MTTILKSIDVAGETCESGFGAVTAARIIEFSSGKIGVCIDVDYGIAGTSSRESSPYKSIEAAEREIRSRFDSFVPELNELQLEAQALLAKFGPFVTKRERDAITANLAVEAWQAEYS